MMQPRFLGSLFFIVLVLVEIAAYGLVISNLGWLAAFSIGIGSIVAGVFVLKRLGQGLLQAMSESAASATSFRFDGLYAGGFATAGAILMILPGFVTDLVGLISALIGWRAWLMPVHGDRAPPTGGRPADKTMDLRPDEWSSQ
ncbi:MAG: FxsA cytoplasmic rane protein [Hyphomicrobiales bacterium]|jgi:UPF0716 protein FxsA|nr:FxsA cytoplasmic rane protein [Hyphomicrobiales bacterium]